MLLPPMVSSRNHDVAQQGDTAGNSISFLGDGFTTDQQGR
jgi:hypothetical protein